GGAQPILVAEGEFCFEVGVPTCYRAARLLMLSGDRWSAPQVVSADGSCIGNARVFLKRDATTRLGSAWERHFGLNASLVFDDPSAIKVDEQVLVEDIDPTMPDVPPRVFRRAEAARTLHADGTKLVAS